MDKSEIFKKVYEDFFGIEKLSNENLKLAEDIAKLDDYENIPTIDVRKSEEGQTSITNVATTPNIDKDQFMKDTFSKIDDMYIKDDSKDLLKNIIEYMRKKEEGIEKAYIPFNMCIYSNNKELVKEIVTIIETSSKAFSYIENKPVQYISLYDVEDLKKIDEAYSQDSIIVLQDFEGIASEDESFKDKFIHKLQNGINFEKKFTIITGKSKDITENVLKQDDIVHSRFVDFKIEDVLPGVQDIYQEVLEKLKDNIELSDEMKVELLDYISATYKNNNLPYTEYISRLVERISFKKEIPKYEKEKSLDEIFAELNELVGLTKVKEMLNDLVNLIELKNKAKDDLKIKNVNLHMVFLGNPGTGKTTIARIIAGILYNLKYVKQNKLIEVSSKDLVAEYVGQTAPKTMAVIQKALGGVLFVDEAYSLASGNGQGNSYNEEAIATLIQAMENYRDELVVIFAGYTKEMQDFLNANSGIVSRIGYTVEFEDYTQDELVAIFMQMMTKSGFVVTDDAIKKVREIIDEYKDTKNFGNARFVRNVYEKSIIKHASNTRDKKSKKILKTITAEDINTENLLKM